MNIKQKDLFILVGIAIVVIIFVTQRKSSPVISQSPTDIGQQSEATSPIQTTPTPNRTDNTNQAPSNTTTISPNQVPPPAPTNTDYFRQFRISDQVKTKFSDQGRIAINLPKEIPFREIDLDFESAIGIYSQSDRLKMAIVAGNISPSEKDMMDYLKSNNTGIPNVDNQKLRIADTSRPLTPSPNSGIKSAKVWQGLNGKNELYRIVYMDREDQKGSYMFVISGEMDFIESSDDAFLKIYESIKTLPPKN